EGQAVQPLVGPLQREVQPGPPQVPEALVVLLDLGHEAPAPGLGLDQHVEMPAGGVVGDVLEPGTTTTALADEPVPGRPRRQPGLDPADVWRVVEDNAEAAFGRQPPT